jgi:predicted RNA-binding protein with PUA-like domain
MRVAYWLMKSEPEEFSIDALKKVKREPWTGVRNYQARNFMWQQMQPGDGVLFYHSNCPVPGVVGLAEVMGEPLPDPTQFDPLSDYFDSKSDPDKPRWWMRHVGFKRKFKQVVSLDRLRGEAGALGEFALLNRGNRLSILPVSEAQWTHVLSLAEDS